MAKILLSDQVLSPEIGGSPNGTKAYRVCCYNRVNLTSVFCSTNGSFRHIGKLDYQSPDDSRIESLRSIGAAPSCWCLNEPLLQMHSISIILDHETNELSCLPTISSLFFWPISHTTT
ncbi:serine dehydratase-like [Platysternon megacephalum]|uniref:Serine dehydratase-like n=1 Tax=Platysternon megacephalum TaxID=55544 RepID=A0A4D9EBM9_9SAUR|nr:serine dehydratase-like [Platysternon megacephalum]